MSEIEISEYKEKYLVELIKLFHEVIHSVNARDYTSEQLDLWVPEKIDIEKWKSRIENNYLIVAKEGTEIVGFSELSPKGSVDLLYVHKDYLRQKIGQKLLDCLTQGAKKFHINLVFTEANITAKPFFEKQGFELMKKQVKTLNDVDFVNYIMKKSI